VISGPVNDGAPTFAPDGNTLYFTRSGANGIESIILVSTRSHGKWSEPQVAPFSGQWYDSSPAMAPDGSFIVFQSSRPRVAPAPATRSSHLWRVDRVANGWGAPAELPDAINISANVYRPSIAADGTLYFISKDAPDKKFRMYSSRSQAGAYQKAEVLPFSDGSTLDVDPEIAPDQSFLLFSSAGREPFKDTHEHLYIVFKHEGAWGPVAPLRYDGDDWAGVTTDDDPRLSPDGKSVYFASDRSPPVHYPLSAKQVKEDLERMKAWDTGNTNVWLLPLAPWLNGGVKG
jgi:WD40-like Beta Propeller Repeat